MPYRLRRFLPCLILALRLVAPAEVCLAGGPKPGLRNATTLEDEARSLERAGRYADADSVLFEALELYRSRNALETPEAARVLLLRSDVLSMIGREPEAIAAAGEAYRIRRAVFGDENSATVEALGILVSLHPGPAFRSGTAAGDAGALPALADVLETQRRLVGPDHLMIARTLTSIGWRSITAGNLAEAERLHREAVAMLRRLFGPDDDRLAPSLFALAFTMRELGESAESKELLGEAIRVVGNRYRVHPWIVKCRNGIAVQSGREESAQLMLMNLQDERRLGETRTPRYLNVLVNLARLYGRLNRFAEAESLLSEAETTADVIEREGGDANAVRSNVLSCRAVLAEWSGRFVEMERWARALRDFHAKLMSPYTGDPGSKTAARDSREGIAYGKSGMEICVMLARARWGQGDIAGAERFLDQAIAAFDDVRIRVGPGTRPATFSPTPYEQRALCRLERGERAGAWPDLEQARGRVLREALPGGDAGPLPLERIQAVLAPDEALVGWLDGEPVAGAFRSWGYVIRSRGPIRWERLASDGASMAERSDACIAFRNAIAGGSGSAFASGDEAFPRDDAAALFRERLAPLARHLAGATSLILVPSPTMGDLPFEALIGPDGRSVGDRYAVRYAPSANVYARLASRGDRGHQGGMAALLVGDPPFREDHLVAWSPGTADFREDGDLRAGPQVLRRALARDRAALGRLPRLPWSRREVESIVRLFPASTPLLGRDASRRSIERLAAAGDLGRFDVLHFATHALVDELNPSRSALILSQVPERGAPADGGEPGVITARDIEGWRLNADLVTLSACETALGRRAFGEGTINFAHAFFRAGSRAVLATLWPVNDEASALLMDRFYRNWLGDPETKAARTEPTMSKAEALRRAKAWLRAWRNARGEQPYARESFWAAFVLIGC